MQLYPGLMQLKSNSGPSDVDGGDMLHRGPMGFEVQGSGDVAETRIVRLIEPLKERRRILLASKEMHQVTQDLEDEIVSLFVLLETFDSCLFSPCFLKASTATITTLVNTHFLIGFDSVQKSWV